MNSALPRISQPVASDARLSLTSGVLPMASTTDGFTSMVVGWESAEQERAEANF
jgi:hypothetical protein